MTCLVLFTRTFTLLFGLLVSALALSAETIPLYLYNTPPPFNPSTPNNLSDYLAKFFSEHSEGNYKFKAIYLPRKRLDDLIAHDQWQGAVIWSNPVWFNDPMKTEYLWSDVLANDHNLVLSHKSLSVEYNSPNSLKELKLGGMLGHIYTELEDMVKEGKLNREDATSYKQNIMKLKAHRIDVMFLPASALASIKLEFPEIDSWLYISKKPRDYFNYAIFFHKSNTELKNYINQNIDLLQFDDKWQNELKTWKNNS